MLEFRHNKDYEELIKKTKEFKKIIAKNNNVKENQVILACGATGALDAIFSLVKIGKEQKCKALLRTPEYFDAFRLLEKKGYNIIAANNKGEFIDKITTEKPDLIYVSDPNNPTGELLKYDEIKRIIDRTNNTTSIVFDRTLVSTGEEIKIKQLLLDNKNKDLIVVDSFSKSYGLIKDRIGYLITTKELTAKMLHDFGHAPSFYSINKAIEVIKNKKYVKNEIVTIKKSNEILIGLTKNNKNLKYIPSASNFALLEIKNNFSANKLKEELIKKQIFVKSSKDIFIPGDKNIRISMDYPKNLKKLINEINKIIM